ncbi:oxidoreductase [Mangrovicella endophytica]|uniref:oxidoreductase n=1 Tax=Mangrovicella endophytica TaxID=2066697 RepID=UPI0018E4A3A5|nr:oxidoreductase [Mangrovicella endophytica]
MAAHFSRRRIITAGSAIAAGLLLARRAAAAVAAPHQKPVLTIGGKIGAPNAGDAAIFDMPTLESLGTTSFVTGNPWQDGQHTFEGVPLQALMDAVEAKGDTLQVTALNFYTAAFPKAGLADDGVILATKCDGAYMPVSDKGPLFVIYPFDDNTTLQHQMYYTRCVWQVARIDIV